MSTYRQYTINKSVYFISIYPTLVESEKMETEENNELIQTYNKFLKAIQSEEQSMDKSEEQQMDELSHEYQAG